MKILKIFGAVLFSVMAFGCTSNQTMEKTVEETEIPFEMSDQTFLTLLENSLLDSGNNFRLKNVIERAKSGEKITIATLGGSVTEGIGPANYRDGYAYKFAEKFKKTYASKPENVILADAGLSGTPSTLGLVRYQSDVVEVLGQNPDIFVIEFAVNDGGGTEFTRCFEALIRDALEADEKTAVIALYSAATYTNSQGIKKTVASHYKIPQVSISDAIRKPMNEGIFSTSDFFADNVHPTKEGHDIMAECLMNLLAKAEISEFDEKIEIPSAYKLEPSFANFTRITKDSKDVVINSGDFSGTDSQTQTVKKTNKGNFPENWYHVPGNENSPFTMELTCKNLIFVYKENGSWTNVDFGVAEVYVDGELIGSYDGGKSGGWNNCQTVVIIDEEFSAPHKVEIKMAEGSEKSGFTIVALGYGN